jgi:hypothetical protein
MLANIFATMLAKVPEERTWYFKMIGNDVTIYKFEAKKYGSDMKHYQLPFSSPSLS